MRIMINGELLRMNELFLFLANEGHSVKLFNDKNEVIGWRDDKNEIVYSIENFIQ